MPFPGRFFSIGSHNPDASTYLIDSIIENGPDYLKRLGAIHKADFMNSSVDFRTKEVLPCTRIPIEIRRRFSRKVTIMYNSRYVELEHLGIPDNLKPKLSVESIQLHTE